MTTGLDRLQQWLREQHVSYALQHHRQAYTSNDLAATLHEAGDHVAKVVIALVGDRLVMLVVPAPAHVDFRRVAQLLHVPAARAAHESEFGERFPDCEVGAMPPFGNLYAMPTYIDTALMPTSRLVFPAGTHRDTLKLATEDYLRVVNPIPAVLTRQPAQAAVAPF